MIVVRDLPTTDQISNIPVRSLVRQRLQELGGGIFDADALGYMVVIDAGDTIADIHAQIGFNILHNRFTGVRYDQSGFTPSFEFIEEYLDCYDMVFVIDDTGWGIEVFVPKVRGVAPALLDMCRRYASLPYSEREM